MDAIEEIEKKLSNYEEYYISENKLLTKKVNEFIEKERKYKEEILSLYNQIEELKLISSNNNKKSKFDSKILKEENNQIKDEYNSVKNNYNKLRKELNTEKIKNELLIDKYNKLSCLFDKKEKENYKLIHLINKKENIDYINNNSIKSLSNEKNDILDYCNNKISLIIKWIENNLISFNNNKEFNILNNGFEYSDIEKNNLIIFDKLMDSLIKAKKTIDDKYNKISKELKEPKNKINKISDIKKDIDLKDNFLERIYNHLYQEIKNEKYFELKNNGINNINNESEFDNYSYFNEIENMINKIFKLLKKIKESSYDKSLDKLITDNTVLCKEIEIMKQKIADLYEDNKVLFNTNNELEKINKELKQNINNNSNNK